MWRLKIGEGRNNPYLFSTNNFAGRQTWELDPDAGTLEERAEIEEARRNFTSNRFKVKPCSDLLWQLQILREKNFKQPIPPVRIEEGEPVTYEKTTAALRRSAHFLSALQASDGHWPAENSGVLFFLPPFAMRDPTPIHQGAKLLINSQNEDGSFPQQEIAGVFKNNCMLHYAMYRSVFPLWALGEYRKKARFPSQNVFPQREKPDV